jgi:[acyl-carrier-protein] S-malonyltransferase
MKLFVTSRVRHRQFSQLCYLFPGQGSQFTGMGTSILSYFPYVSEIFEKADHTLGMNLSKYMMNSSKEELAQTEIAQPALYVYSLAIMHILRTEGFEFRPLLIGGHSLGEFTAACASGAISFEDGLRLVRQRGLLMKDAAKDLDSCMAALFPADLRAVQMAVEESRAQTGEIVDVANINTNDQVVVSGQRRAVELAIAIARKQHSRQFRPRLLSVSAPFHSAAMLSVEARLASFLAEIPFGSPHVPLVVNYSASLVRTGEELSQALVLQTARPVQWADCMNACFRHGATNFVELGASVLSKLASQQHVHFLKQEPDHPALHKAITTRALVTGSDIQALLLALAANQRDETEKEYKA